jgi:hypothetical protein
MSPEQLAIVYVDLGWHRRTGEKAGLPPTQESEVLACLDAGSRSEWKSFNHARDAVEWPRDRAELVLVRLGPTEDQMYSAGVRRATRQLAEYGGKDLRPLPEWPPADWQE